MEGQAGQGPAPYSKKAELLKERVRAKLEELGQVHLSALEIYRSLQKRRADLESQYRDLLAGRDKLKGFLREVENKMESILKDALDQMDIHFSQIFKELSGGEAHLHFTGSSILKGGWRWRRRCRENAGSL